MLGTLEPGQVGSVANSNPNPNPNPNPNSNPNPNPNPARWAVSPTLTRTRTRTRTRTPALTLTLTLTQVGSVAKVQALLEAQAALFVPLELVAVAGEAGAVAGEAGTTAAAAAAGDSGGGSALASALLRACVHAVPRDGIRSSYSRLVALFQHQPSVARRQRASKGAQDLTLTLI